MVRVTGVGVIDALSLSLSHARALRQCGESQLNDDGGLIFVAINFCLVARRFPTFLEMDKKEFFVFCGLRETLENDDDYKKKESKKIYGEEDGGHGNEREKKSTQRNHNLSPL